MIKIGKRLHSAQKAGVRYKDKMFKRIQSYANLDRLIKKAMILLASAKAGNNSSELIKVYYARLDNLLDRGTIDTFFYKVLFKKL